MRFLLSILAAATVAAAQSPAPIRLLMQADDMAALHSINLGSIESYKKGIVRATNVIVPGPWMLEAARLLNENPGLDVGVHLALTSEWTYVKWSPLTRSPSLVDSNGYFFPGIWSRPNSKPGTALKDNNPKLDEVEREFRAQIEMAKRLIPHTNYASAHMGFWTAYPEWTALVKKLCAEYGLDMRENHPEIKDLRVNWGPRNGPPIDRGAKLAEALDKLEPGTWFMLEHASLDDAEMAAINADGRVGKERFAMTTMWTDPRVLEVVRRRNIQLIGYRDLDRPKP